MKRRRLLDSISSSRPSSPSPRPTVGGALLFRQLDCSSAVVHGKEEEGEGVEEGSVEGVAQITFTNVPCPPGMALYNLGQTPLEIDMVNRLHQFITRIHR